MKKRFTTLLIALALLVTVMPAPAFAAQSSLDDKAVYYTPASDYKSGDCILTASKIMIRRACIIKGRGDWTKISNESLRSIATIFGLLLNSFKVDVEGLVYKVDCGYFNGNGDAARVKEIEDLLRVHPEGIVVHGDNAAVSGTHGVLVVSVKNGVLYAADSSRNTGLNNKGIQKWEDTTMLNVSRVTKYWYISEINASTRTKPSSTSSAAAVPTSTLKIKSVKAPSRVKKGKAFTIKGTVKSNKKIKKVTVQVLDSAGTAVLKASKKPNAKSYSVKKLDSKIKFKKLKRGSYTYQVIATDSVQTLTLVNKPFNVY
ncbi:MAG: hypothetical protein IKG44_04250 [Mogibacterium sp.]|nr:hypothetical protein [Mogibacterium sp.]MBQ3428907.1 hypothetical protein [Mogibacterium sp.]MBR3376871.1 hypothetical protein [Mogibacterium sp.]